MKNEKYIGVYTYKDEIRLENAIPPIVEPEIFYKVQEMLRYNQRAAAHMNSKTDYLLTEKLFCGKCGAKMIGISHTGALAATARSHCMKLMQGCSKAFVCPALRVTTQSKSEPFAGWRGVRILCYMGNIPLKPLQCCSIDIVGLSIILWYDNSGKLQHAVL